MKKKLQDIFLFLWAVTTIGCYEDKGNYDYRHLPEVTISGIEDQYTVYVNSPFRIPATVEVRNGELKEVVYEWIVDGKVISDQKQLDVIVNFAVKPGLYGQYNVIDKSTGIKYIKTFRVDVSSTFMNGWLILSDLGDKSQLCFMRNDNVFAENIYHIANNEYLSGGAFALSEHFLPYNELTGQVFVACQKGPGYSVELDGNSLQKIIHTEKEFVGGKPADFCPQTMDAVSGWDYMISAGKLYTREVISDEPQYQEGAFPNIPVEGNYKLSPFTIRGNKVASDIIISFDELSRSYVLLRNGVIVNFDYNNDNNKVFKPSNMDKTLLGGGAIQALSYPPQDQFLTFLKGDDSKIYVHQFLFSGWMREKYQSEVQIEFPKPELINKDTKFAVCSGRDYAYFTSGNELWVYKYKTNECERLRNDFTGPIREIALCLTNYERLAIAVTNAADASKSDFMVLDVSVVGRGATVEGTEVIGKCGKVVDIMYKVGSQWDIY